MAGKRKTPPADVAVPKAKAKAKVAPAVPPQLDHPLLEVIDAAEKCLASELKERLVS